MKKNTTKKAQVKPSKRSPFITLVIVVCIVLGLAVIAFNLHVTTAPIRHTVLKDRPEAEVQKFTEDKITPVLTMLCNQNYPVSGIQQRFDDVYRTIHARFGVQLKIKWITKYINSADIITAFSYPLRGSPEIDVSIPAMMDSYEELKSSEPDFEKCFETLVTSTIMHELDHMESEDIVDVIKMVPFEVRVRSECRAWNKTSRYTLDALSKAGLKLSAADASIYKVWLRAGQNGTNDMWVSFITHAYNQAR